MSPNQNPRIANRLSPDPAGLCVCLASGYNMIGVVAVSPLFVVRLHTIQHSTGDVTGATARVYFCPLFDIVRLPLFWLISPIFPDSNIFLSGR